MLRVAVLGAGRIGKIHAANVAGNPKAKLVTIADPYGTAARDLADHLGCEASLDPIAAIERTDVDAIIVGTPTDTHVSLTLHAVKLGKAVLCEKPIDLDIAKVDAAVQRSNASKAASWWHSTAALIPAPGNSAERSMPAKSATCGRSSSPAGTRECRRMIMSRIPAEFFAIW